MSMTAVFVQTAPDALSKLRADPSLAALLFQKGPPPRLPPLEIPAEVQERIRTAGPGLLAGPLARVDPKVRQKIESLLGHSVSELAGGSGGDALLGLMKLRADRLHAMAPAGPPLSLEKAWHGVHYLLCGKAEPGRSLLSQAVMGGEEIGDDEEGFSGYGPARCFEPAQVAALARALSDPALEAKAAARFDAAEMSRLEIYPGWDSDDDVEWLMTEFRRLREFYADAAEQGNAIVTCLV